MEIHLAKAVRPNYERCLGLGHPIVDYPNGLWWCQIDHERSDVAFNAWSQSVLEQARINLSKGISVSH
jgi:hypothetical protein